VKQEIRQKGKHEIIKPETEIVEARKVEIRMQH
jgi:hypothetical protein